MARISDGWRQNGTPNRETVTAPITAKDPGGKEEAGLLFFQWNGTSSLKNMISYGPLAKAQRLPAFISPLVTWIIWGKNWIIAVAGKDGLVVFFRNRKKSNMLLKKNENAAKLTPNQNQDYRNKQTKDRSQSKIICTSYSFSSMKTLQNC